MQNGCTLVMDTSASPLLLALEKEGKLYTARRKGIKQEKLLFPVLHRLLGKAGAQLTDVTRLFIIRGPGRFTGIRIALTFGSMMKMLNHTEVRAATIFEVVRAQVLAGRAYSTWLEQHPTGVLAVILHAFREEYFLQIFDHKHTGPQWLSREELLAQLLSYGSPLFLAGTDKEFSSLEGLVGSAFPLAPYKECCVQAKTLIRLCVDKRFATNALDPLYLKPARFELTEPK